MINLFVSKMRQLPQILLVFIFLQNCIVADEIFPLDRFHVCTVATNGSPNLDKLHQSCAKHGIHLNVLGMGAHYPCNGTKLTLIADWLKTFEDDEIVMFVDGYDVLILADKQTILDKFLKMNVPFLIALERNCYPCYEYLGHYPPSLTTFRYINTGTYIGYAGHIKTWLKDLAPDSTKCDQIQTAIHYGKDENARALYFFDSNCDLFLPLLFVSENEVVIDIENQTLHCLSTNSTPCVIHANGGSFLIWNKVYEQLIR